MKLSQLKQQIEELDASYFPRESKREKDKLLITHGPELLRRLLAAEEALKYKLTVLRIFYNRLHNGAAIVRRADLEEGIKQLSTALSTVRGGNYEEAE